MQRDGETLTFNGIVHRNRETIIVELEPTEPSEEVDQRSVPSPSFYGGVICDFFNFYRLVKTPVSKIQNTKTLDELSNAIVTEVRKITGFDRVMVYRFDCKFFVDGL